MRMVWNGLMGLYFRFTLMLLLSLPLSAGSCKNAAASRSMSTLLEKKQQEAHTLSNLPKMDQAGNETSEDNPKSLKDHAAETKDNPTDESLKAHPEQTDQADAPPSFTLQDITIEAGTSQSTTLGVVNSAEGYMVKSVSVTKNTTTRYANQFGLDKLTNQPIPPSELAFTLTTHQNLKADQYLLKIKIGKTGAGSKATEQLVQSTITVTNGNENKIKIQEDSSNIKQITQGSSDASVKQEDEQNEAEVGPTAQKIEESPVCSFDKEGVESSNIATVSCKIGESIIIPYHIEGHQDDYKIKSIQIIKQGDRNSTNKKLFGLEGYRNSIFQKRIKLSPTIQKAGTYQLIIKIKRGSGDPLLIAKCNIAVVP